MLRYVSHTITEDGAIGFHGMWQSRSSDLDVMSVPELKSILESQPNFRQMHLSSQLSLVRKKKIALAASLRTVTPNKLQDFFSSLERLEKILQFNKYKDKLQPDWKCGSSFAPDSSLYTFIHNIRAMLPSMKSKIMFKKNNEQGTKVRRMLHAISFSLFNIWRTPVLK